MRYVLAFLMVIGGLVPGKAAMQFNDLYQIVLQVMPASSPVGEGMNVMVSISTSHAEADVPFSVTVPNGINVGDGWCGGLCQEAVVIDNPSGATVSARLVKVSGQGIQSAELRFFAYTSPAFPSGPLFTFNSDIESYRATVTYVSGSGESVVGLSYAKQSAEVNTPLAPSLVVLPTELVLPTGVISSAQIRVELPTNGMLVIRIPPGVRALPSSDCVDADTLVSVGAGNCDLSFSVGLNEWTSMKVKYAVGSHVFMLDVRNDDRETPSSIVLVLRPDGHDAVGTSVPVRLGD